MSPILQIAVDCGCAGVGGCGDSLTLTRSQGSEERAANFVP